MTLVATDNASTLAFQGAFQVLSLMGLTGSLFPQSATVTDGSYFDFIIVGGGTAGLTIANGLSECEDVSVLVIEAGGNPPVEAAFLGLFAYLPNTTGDWQFYSQNDDYTSQGLKNGKIPLLQGKMLGGSSSVGHGINIRGHPADYDEWAKAADDSSWGWDGLYNYFLQREKLVDEDILNSSYKQYHGTEGNVIVTREANDDIINPLLGAFEEIGYETVLDLNANETLGFAQPLMQNYVLRQSSAVTYLTPVKSRSNLYVLTGTQVTSIIFKGNTAVGVKALTSSNETISIHANKEVIVSAGAFNSPKLLLASGVGPKADLEALDIDVVSDLPGVGQNLQDHVSVLVYHKLQESNATATADPTKFPAPCYVGKVSLDTSVTTQPQYQAIGLYIPNDSLASYLLCSFVFGYKDDICEVVLQANVGRNIMISALNKLHPRSRGAVTLKSTDPLDAPVIIMGTYTNSEDLSDMSAYAQDFNRVVNSNYFQNIGAELLDLNLSKCSSYELASKDYWDCFVLEMSATMYHYAGTCSLGNVTDARLNVKGVSNLRVADASVIPYLTSGNIEVAVATVAQKAVDLIKEDNNLC